jgi:hypothetical protein
VTFTTTINEFIAGPLTLLWIMVNDTLFNAFVKLREEGLKPVYGFITDKMIGAIKALTSKFDELLNKIDEVGSAMEDFVSGPGVRIRSAMSSIKSAVESVISSIDRLISKLNSVDIPSWLRGHSPPPMADWFMQISDQASRLSSMALPKLTMQLNAVTPRVAQQRTSVAPLNMARFATAGVSRSMSMNMGGVSINNGMDSASFEAMVTRAIRRGFG